MGRWIYKVDFLVRKSGETRYHNKAKFTSEEIAKERILYLFKSLKKQKILPYTQKDLIPNFPTESSGLFLEEIFSQGKSKTSN